MEGNGIAKIPHGTLPPEVAGYMQNVQLMHGIVSAMKEVPVLESEVPTDTNALVKVEFPEEGGILTYMSNHELPYRGFPYMEFVEKIDVFKKLVRGGLSGLFHALKENKLKIVLALPLLFLGREVFTAGVYAFYNLFVRSRIKSTMYSKSIRELYRAFDTPRANEDLKTLELRLMLKDLICSILEFDNAYRFRFQDVIVEMDKEAIKKNTVKELLRLFNLMTQRENDQKVKDTWKLFKLVVRFYFSVDRKLAQMLGDVLGELNIEQVALTPEDKQFAGLRKDYNFGFKL